MKNILRKKILEKRNSIPLPERKKKDILIKQRLFSLSAFTVASTILFYSSFITEFDTNSII